MLKQLFVLLTFCTLSIATKASVPDIINFTTKEYKSHSINYCFTQDSSGVMYIGNAYGVLEYDGQNWRKTPLVDGKSALSLDIDQNGRVYVGSSSEFGYLEKNASGLNVYVSLKTKLPKHDINEILDLVCFNDAVYFRSLYTLYCYKNNEVTQLTKLSKELLVYYLGVNQKKMVASKLGVGILNISGIDFKISNTAIKNSAIHKVLTLKGNTTLFISSNEIIFENDPKLFEKTNKQLESLIISSALKINDTEFLIGTINKGLFHLNIKGEIISNFNMNTGLQDNFIHDLFLDNSGNVWLAYNNGVGLLKWNSPVRYITSSMGVEGMGYCAVVKNDTLYTGTSSGLYFLPQWKSSLTRQKKFQKIVGISGIINELKIHNGTIIACQAAEFYQIHGKKAVRISDGEWIGAWSW
ncbi:MAG: ligand-binding sensor domain-containing protein, partial [Glaciecola sp.]